jgi:hypothetical protein
MGEGFWSACTLAELKPSFFCGINGPWRPDQVAGHNYLGRHHSAKDSQRQWHDTDRVRGCELIKYWTCELVWDSMHCRPLEKRDRRMISIQIERLIKRINHWPLAYHYSLATNNRSNNQYSFFSSLFCNYLGTSRYCKRHGKWYRRRGCKSHNELGLAWGNDARFMNFYFGAYFPKGGG